MPDLAISVRAAQSGDEEFLFAVYASTRMDEFISLGWENPQVLALLRIQYSARQQSYKAGFPGSVPEIILLDERSAGSFWIFRSEQEHRLVDIALLPEFRGQGAGSALVRTLINEARAAGTPLRSSVLKTNPGSMRFHARIGFIVSGEDDAYWRLEWRETRTNP